MIRGYLIDDELAPRITLKHLLSNMEPEVQIVGEADSLKKGLDEIRNMKVDVLFLDIEMPEHKGLDIIDLIDFSIGFEIVFVTAYSEYAIQAFKLSAFDYLLKPVRKNEIQETLLRLQKRLTKNLSSQSLAILSSNLKDNGNEKYLLRTHAEEFLINVNDIVSLEADGMYTHIVLANKKITASKPMKEILDDLPNFFFRTHRSYSVNLKQVEQPVRLTTAGVKTKIDHYVSVSTRNKNMFLGALRNYSY
ncbi:MAG: response regulator [Vicingaceae bacterium]|nr:response regulator [Vicingaceae bacterium]